LARLSGILLLMHNVYTYTKYNSNSNRGGGALMGAIILLVCPV